MNTKYLKNAIVAIMFISFAGLCVENTPESMTAFALSKLAFLAIILSGGYAISLIESKGSKSESERK